MNRLCISPDKRYLAAAGHHTIKLYDIKSTNPAAVLTFEGHTGNITGVAFHCEGKWMVTSSEDGKLFLNRFSILCADSIKGLSRFGTRDRGMFNEITPTE